MALKSHGVTKDTAQNLLLSAGAYYKNLKYGEHYEIVASTVEGALEVVADSATGGTQVDLETVTPTCPDAKVGDYVKKETTGWYGQILGATSGGGKVTIEPEYLDPEVDGATVLVRGLKQKVAETASMEVNLTEFKEGLIVDALHLVEDKQANVTGYKKYISKRSLSDSDYLDNVAFVGTKVNGEQIIIIFPNAIITGAFELEGKNKEQATYTVTAECTASFEQDDLEHLPYEIYYPSQTV